jgi:hypothetical protein
MELYAVRLLVKKLKNNLVKAGLTIERDDDKYLVARGLDHTVIMPKINTDRFIRVLIVEYDQHIVRSIQYSGYYYLSFLEKFRKVYNRYLLAK